MRYSSEATHLRAGKDVLWMRGQPRVENAINAWMPFHPFGDAKGVLAVALHTEMQSLQAACH